MEAADIQDSLTTILVEQFGATQRRSWGHDALYRDGRLFVLFDGSDLVGKWPDDRRSTLLASTWNVRPYVSDDDPTEARWLRIPLGSFDDVSEAVSLSLEAAEYVHTPAGAPSTRKRVRR
ncbi:MAG TPA: hypothetical protein VFZ12_06185 [Dehalococcoidia bacterium]|nr:hypothetical protein [Dehalococcoidia bacterium]